MAATEGLTNAAIAKRLFTRTPEQPGRYATEIEETLTVIRLGIKGKPRHTLESTNPCASMIDTVHDTRHNLQVLVLGRDGAAVDPRRDARSQESDPQRLTPRTRTRELS
jgi:hypothetical protein